MKNISYFVFLLFLFQSCSNIAESVSKDENLETMIYQNVDLDDGIGTWTILTGKDFQPGDSYSIVDLYGLRKEFVEGYQFIYPFSNYFNNFLFVKDSIKTKGKTYAINKKGEFLFEAYWFDNGLDYTRNGLFRVKRNGKIGYANELGEVIIPCRYECAHPFDKGVAKVSKKCHLEKDDEYSSMVSDSWVWINVEGEEVPEFKEGGSFYEVSLFADSAFSPFLDSIPLKLIVKNNSKYSSSLLIGGERMFGISLSLIKFDENGMPVSDCPYENFNVLSSKAYVDEELNDKYDLFKPGEIKEFNFIISDMVKFECNMKDRKFGKYQIVMGHAAGVTRPIYVDLNK